MTKYLNFIIQGILSFIINVLHDLSMKFGLYVLCLFMIDKFMLWDMILGGKFLSLMWENGIECLCLCKLKRF